MELLNSPSRGTIAGEGAASFIVGITKQPGAVAELSGVSTLYKPLWEGEVIGHIMKFLEDNNCTPADIDLIVTGRNGDIDQDEIYEEVADALFPRTWKPALNTCAGNTLQQQHLAFGWRMPL